MEVECIGNTQIIHMEETGITQQTIGQIPVKEFQVQEYKITKVLVSESKENFSIF